ncbi:hypothetical protein GGX14DRAFT_571797 [Mycena pura]|uniref:Uncharacterized protein n=1 Tax=Mycena pura TaxID=153505 RepID=A0AAD6V2T6_9AGAR|nr:hypothetical protein GGX14DRAFT_571797 [Mycena pura]
MQISRLPALRTKSCASSKVHFDTRRAWNARRGEISTVIDELRKGDLRGVRIQGRRPDTGDTTNLVEQPDKVQLIEQQDDHVPSSLEPASISGDVAGFSGDDEYDTYNSSNTGEIDPYMAGILDQVTVNWEHAKDTFEFPERLIEEPEQESELVYDFSRNAPSPPIITEREHSPFVLDPQLDPDYAVFSVAGPSSEAAMDLDAQLTSASELSINHPRKRALTKSTHEDESAPRRKSAREAKASTRAKGVSYEDMVISRR